MGTLDAIFLTAEGITIGRAHAYYPYNQSGSIRETTLHSRYVEAAELRSATSSASCFGVKGQQSAFSDIVSGLPLTAPIDYMHCILLGVFPELLKHLLKKMAPTYRKEINDLVPSLTCPRELITYSRKIRSLDEINQFKANEFFNWMFYLSPVVFWKRIPKFLYDNLLSFVFGVRLLLESSKEEDVVVAERLLNQFRSSVVDIFDGNERVETINVLSLRHPPTQVRRFGPLFSFSAMSFESANRILGEVFTGSHHECEVVCRRFLQRQCLLDLHNSSEESVFGGLVRQLLGQENFNKSDFSAFMLETESLKMGRLLYPEATFLNRLLVNKIYFDSPAYSRAPFSGKCNSFVRYKRKNVE